VYEVGSLPLFWKVSCQVASAIIKKVKVGLSAEFRGRADSQAGCMKLVLSLPLLLKASCQVASAIIKNHVP
jgi:hypothetical protein